MRIKGQGTFIKWLTTKMAGQNKQRFYSAIEADLPAIIRKINGAKQTSLHIVSFSSANDFPEQMLSILSFIKYVGYPSQWTLYSDGTHTDKQTQLLQAALPFVKVVFSDLSPGNQSRFALKESLSIYRNELLDYARKKPLGKKLLFYLNHPVNQSTMFLDSDILFYQKAEHLPDALADNNSVSGWFLPDCEGGKNLNQSYLSQHPFEMYQINSGLIVMNRELQHTNEALALLTQTNGDYEYFTEQTILHSILQKNHYFPLDPRLYIIDASDQFTYSYANDVNSIAARHFTGPVRHKMWQRDWKWQLSVN